MNIKELAETILNCILGFIWPPYGWKLKLAKFNAEDRANFAEWYKNVYVPWRKAESERLLIEAQKPCYFLKHVRRHRRVVESL